MDGPWPIISAADAVREPVKDFIISRRRFDTSAMTHRRREVTRKVKECFDRDQKDCSRFCSILSADSSTHRPHCKIPSVLSLHRQIISRYATLFF